tara:strand:- start:2705 stop:3268 length:564 start_codon:yes stop_codon:yes gene_type:complete
MTIYDIFLKEPQKPFTYNLNVIGLNPPTVEDLFIKIKDTFINGLRIITENKNTHFLDISNVTNKHMQLMKEYMLSIGIELHYNKYTIAGKDYLYRQFLSDISDINGIDIKTTINWHTNFIENIHISSDPDITTESVSKLSNMIHKHYKVNHFLNLTKSNVLHDFAICIKFTNESFTHYIYFDYAKNS